MINIDYFQVDIYYYSTIANYLVSYIRYALYRVVIQKGLLQMKHAVISYAKLVWG